LYAYSFKDLVSTAQVTGEQEKLQDNYPIPQSRVSVEKLTVTQLVKEFPALYGNWRFITVNTRGRHWSLS
jgi:hypothetical protein